MIRPVDTDAVVLDGIVKTFGRTRAVDGVHLSIPQGETIALLGPNGAGKTTTISILLGLLRPDFGTVQVLGETPQRAAASGRIGAMLQDGGMPPGARIAELLGMLAAQYTRPAELGAVIRLAQLQGLEQRRVDRLSGGQLQRLRLAVALIGDPDLLVLDEPTAAMDVEARRAFWKVMRDVTASGRTVLFSTHYLEEADAFADRIVLLSAGRLIADGTPRQIKASLGTRVIRFSSSSRLEWTAVEGVTRADVRNQRVELHSGDSDLTLRAVLRACPDAHDIEVETAGLEEAFITLTKARSAA